MGSGADLAQEAADVLLLRAQPSAVPAALDLARSTLRIMRQKPAWAAAYNVLGIPLAPARSIRLSTFCSRPGWPPRPWRSARSACGQQPALARLAAILRLKSNSGRPGKLN